MTYPETYHRCSVGDSPFYLSHMDSLTLWHMQFLNWLLVLIVGYTQCSCDVMLEYLTTPAIPRTKASSCIYCCMCSVHLNFVSLSNFTTMATVRQVSMLYSPETFSTIICCCRWSCSWHNTWPLSGLWGNAFRIFWTCTWCKTRGRSYNISADNL